MAFSDDLHAFEGSFCVMFRNQHCRMLLDPMYLILDPTERYKDRIGVLKALTVEAQFTRGYATVGKQILESRWKWPTVATMVMQMALERNDVSGPIVCPPTLHRRAKQAVEGHPKCSFARVNRRCIKFVAINIFDYFADLFD